MKTQALGWLAAAVVAAGLNASYHDGGLQWAHQVADRVGHSSAAVLALASGRADQFLAEARLVSDQVAAQPIEVPSRPLTTTVARAQATLARTQAGLARIEEVSARQQACMARIEADRARMEARLAAHTARLRMVATSFDPTAMNTIEIPTRCQRIRISVPRPPRVRVPDAVVDLDVPGADPL